EPDVAPQPAPTPEPTRAGRISPDLQPLEEHPRPRLHHFDRRAAPGRLADMVRRAVPVVAGGRAPADEVVVADGEQLPRVGVSADHHETRDVPARTAGDPIGPA